VGYPRLLAPGGILAGRLLHGVDITSLTPLDAAGHLDGRRLAIVHGAADTRVSVKHATMLAEAVRAGGASAEPWILPGVIHARAAFVEPDEYERRLVDFLSRTSLSWTRRRTRSACRSPLAARYIVGTCRRGELREGC